MVSNQRLVSYRWATPDAVCGRILWILPLGSGCEYLGSGRLRKLCYASDGHNASHHLLFGYRAEEIPRQDFSLHPPHAYALLERFETGFSIYEALKQRLLRHFLPSFAGYSICLGFATYARSFALLDQNLHAFWTPAMLGSIVTITSILAICPWFPGKRIFDCFITRLYWLLSTLGLFTMISIMSVFEISMMLQGRGGFSGKRTEFCLAYITSRRTIWVFMLTIYGSLAGILLLMWGTFAKSPIEPFLSSCLRALWRSVTGSSSPRARTAVS
ncbi:uncharacterized protein B0I36DRAFT_435132, partial [Microdochium trichocladiopsis]